MRKWLAVGLIGALVVAGAVAVLAETRSAGGRIDRQTFRWTDGGDSTSSTQWTSIDELRAGTGCQGDHSTSAVVSLELQNGSSPVEVRVAMDDPLVVCEDCTEPEGLMRPRSVHFEGSSSFTFITKRAVGGHGTDFDVQWRLAAGAPPNAEATLESGTLNVVWDDLEGTCL